MENTARNVLVVDDDIAMRQMVMSLLDDVGHEVNEASNKVQAMDYLERRPYDAVISDVKMPGGSGIELLREVREKHATTPVILMTAFGSIQSAVEAMREGAFDFVTKPFKRDILLSTLGRAFERRDELSPGERRRCSGESAERVVALADPVGIDGEVLHTAANSTTSFLDNAIDRQMTLSTLGDLYTTKVLEYTGGNKARAAKILGINRRTLYRRGFGGEVDARNITAVTASEAGR